MDEFTIALTAGTATTTHLIALLGYAGVKTLLAVLSIVVAIIFIRIGWKSGLASFTRAQDLRWDDDGSLASITKGMKHWEVEHGIDNPEWRDMRKEYSRRWKAEGYGAEF